MQLFFLIGFTCHVLLMDSRSLSQEIGGTPQDSGLAVSNPDEYAWRLFVALNQPAKTGDGSVVWENWALARIVYADPNKTPAWEDCIKPASDQRKDRFESLPIQQRILRAAKEKEIGKSLGRRSQKIPDGNATAFDPNLAGIGDSEPENDEVRMNRSTFDTVVKHELWNVDGQERAFERGDPIAFEPDAKEIKAEWRNISSLKPDIQKTFHIAEFEQDGKKQIWGLVALHITTKDLPNWFWATWEHESTAQREAVVRSEDRWGAKLRIGNSESDVTDLLTGKEKGDPYPSGEWAGPSSQLSDLLKESGLTENKWNHYVLRGTQVDFTDKFGRPTILANSVIEEGFQSTSSCITCHAKAGIGPRMRRSDEKNMLPVFNSSDPPIGDVGLPNPEWYFGERTEPTNRKYLQFDFVWSTIRAKRKGSNLEHSDEPTDPANAHPLKGKWTYRALMNDAKEVGDSEVGNVTLGTGVLEITSVEEFEGISKIAGTLAINESTSDHRWNLKVTGTAVVVDHKWLLEFEAKGISHENNPESDNYWHYEYEATSFKSGMKFTDSGAENGRVPILAGRVSRVAKHPTGAAAKKLREGSVVLKDLDPKTDFYPSGFSGTFQMVKQR